MDKKKVIITGATGLVGQRLIPFVKAKGYEVYVLSRKPSQDPNFILWDLKNKTIEVEKLHNTYAVIHLAGAGIADERWTDARKEEIISSRVDSAGLILDKFKEIADLPKVFISASGIGYYGMDTGSVLVDESSPNTTDFISIVTQKWEQAVAQFTELGSRVVMLRTGIVLAKDGGALPKMAQPIKMFVGSPIASGSQYISWIHIDDLCRLYVEALEHESYQGPINAVADEALTNSEFTIEVAKVLKRPLWAPNVPEFVLKTIFGEMSSLLIGGNKVSNHKLHKLGFMCTFKKLSAALNNIYNN